MNPMYAAFDKELIVISSKLINRIEELAYNIVKENEDVTGFCMGMGSISFGVNFIESDILGEEFERDEDLYPSDMLAYQWNREEDIKEIDFIIDHYDSMFKLTGHPIKMDKVRNEITVEYDW